MPKGNEEQKLGILEWLENQSDNVVKTYRENSGFHVRAQAKVKTQNGTIKSVNQALDDAGFEDGEEIGGYRVQKNEFEEGRFVFKFFVMNPPVDDTEGVF
jgi:hypothetical protein